MTRRIGLERRSGRLLASGALVVLGWGVGGCRAVLDGSAGAAGSGEGSVCLGGVCSEADEPYAGPGEAPMRRLNNVEYRNTLSDLFGASEPAVSFPEEGRTNGLDTLSSALPVSQLHIDGYVEAATLVVDELMDADPAGLRASWCDFATGNATSDLDCAGEIVSDFAERAWRRPLGAWEDADPVAEFRALLLADGPLGGLALETRLRTALEAVLVSPRFVYRVELADEEGRLDSASLAARLSYFLWSSAPDAQLLASDLLDEAVLASEVERLEKDQRFDRFVRRFPDLWLGLERLAKLERDPAVYPTFNPGLAEKMNAETHAFLESFIRNESLPFSQLLVAETPMSADPELNAIYGESPRGGLLTQAAIMTLTGATNRTSPVRRGLWVLEKLLCAPPPPPPAAAIAMITEELEADETITERERLEMHRAEPSCAGCHVMMDPIGLGFENYDSVGAYRTEYPNGRAIEPGGVLSDGNVNFEGPLELAQILSSDERLQSCVVRHLFEYGTGRLFEHEDDPLVDVVRRFAGEEEASFADLLKAVAISDGFRRRTEEE